MSREKSPLGHIPQKENTPEILAIDEQQNKARKRLEARRRKKEEERGGRLSGISDDSIGLTEDKKTVEKELLSLAVARRMGLAKAQEKLRENS